MRILLASLFLLAGCAHSQSTSTTERLSAPVVAPHSVDACLTNSQVCKGVQFRRLSRTGPIMMGPE